MTQEQPLVSIGEIARHLTCSKDLARKELKRKRVPVFYIGRCVAVYPSTLKCYLEQSYSGFGLPETVLNDPKNDPLST